MVLLSDADGDILLLPVGVRHVKNTQKLLLHYYILFFSDNVTKNNFHIQLKTR